MPYKEFSPKPGEGISLSWLVRYGEYQAHFWRMDPRGDLAVSLCGRLVQRVNLNHLDHEPECPLCSKILAHNLEKYD